MIAENKCEYPQCPVCVHQVTCGLDSFCPTHKTALDNIRKGYNDWVRGYGSLTKNEYLRLLTENIGAGEWVVEVAEYVLREGLTERLLDDPPAESHR